MGKMKCSVLGMGINESTCSDDGGGAVKEGVDYQNSAEQCYVRNFSCVTACQKQFKTLFSWLFLLLCFDVHY